MIKRDGQPPAVSACQKSNFADGKITFLTLSPGYLNRYPGVLTIIFTPQKQTHL